MIWSIWRLKKSDVLWFSICWKREYTFSLICWDNWSLSTMPLILTAANLTIWETQAHTICQLNKEISGQNEAEKKNKSWPNTRTSHNCSTILLSAIPFQKIYWSLFLRKSPLHLLDLVLLDCKEDKVIQYRAPNKSDCHSKPRISRYTSQKLIAKEGGALT